MIPISEEMVEVTIDGKRQRLSLLEQSTLYAVESFAMAVATHRHVGTSTDSENDRRAIAEDLQYALRVAFGCVIADRYELRVVLGDQPGHLVVEAKKKETL